MSDELVKRLRFWVDFGYGAQVSKDLKEAADLLEARRTVSGQDESASDTAEAAALRAFDKATQDGHLYACESYCAGYVDSYYAAPIPATEPKEPK